MYPYNAGDTGRVKQSILDQYPDHVELVKTKEDKKPEQQEKEVATAPNKAVKKASTK